MQLGCLYLLVLLTNGISSELLLLVVAAEQDGAPDADLSTGWVAIWVIAHFLVTFQAEFGAWHWGAYSACMPLTGQGQE